MGVEKQKQQKDKTPPVQFALTLLKTIAAVLASAFIGALATFVSLYGRIKSFNNGKVFEDFEELRAWATFGTWVFLLFFFSALFTIVFRKKINNYLNHFIGGKND